MKQQAQLYEATPAAVYSAALSAVGKLGYAVEQTTPNEVILAATKRRMLNPHSVQPVQFLITPDANGTRLSVSVGWPEQRGRDISIGDAAARRRAVRDVFGEIDADLTPSH